MKAINEKGFGHIASEAMTRIYGKDIFAHRSWSCVGRRKKEQRKGAEREREIGALLLML